MQKLGGGFPTSPVGRGQAYLNATTLNIDLTVATIFESWLRMLTGANGSSLSRSTQAASPGSAFRIGQSIQPSGGNQDKLTEYVVAHCAHHWVIEVPEQTYQRGSLPAVRRRAEVSKLPLRIVLGQQPARLAGWQDLKNSICRERARR